MTKLCTGFRRQLIHSHSNRAGYLDLDGCIIADLLPRYVFSVASAFLVMRRARSDVPTVALFLPVRNARHPSLHLVLWLFVEKTLWLYVDNVIEKWASVSSCIHPITC